MVEHGERAGLAFEAFEIDRLECHVLREYFDCYRATQVELDGAINHAHGSGTDLTGDAIATADTLGKIWQCFNSQV